MKTPRVHRKYGFFLSGYEEMFYKGGISGILTEFIHNALERNLKIPCFHHVLDVGGGSGKHVKYVKLKF